MKKTLISLLCIALISISNVSNSKGLCDWHKAYLGVDTQLRFMNFGKEHGSTVFRNNIPQGNFFIGIKFNDYIAVESGIETTIKSYKNVRLTPGKIANGGTPVTVIRPFKDYVTSVQVTSPHISLIWYFPVCDFSNFRIMGSIGIARPRIKLSANLIGDPIGPLNISRTFIEEKNVLRTSIGMQYMLSHCSGFRVRAVFENTERFNNMRPTECNVAPQISSKVKNTITLGAGVFAFF